MTKRIITIIVFISSFIATSLFAQSDDETKIRKVLNNQETAWNAGDIESFMKTYWQSDSLLFIGKSGVTYGWKKTLNNYKTNYPDTAAMGHLSFNLVEFKPLSPGYYFVVGKWHLQRTIGDIGGLFTLIFRKINGMWLIVADHSS